MSLFDREGIPESLLQGQYISPEEEKTSEREEIDSVQDKYDFDEDITILRAYSLISISTNEQLFDMHRLVQFSTRKWLELHGELAYWQGRYISILDIAFPTGDYVHWPTCQALFPHVEVAISYKMASNDYRVKRAAILYRGAWFTNQSGRYRIAAEMARVSLEEREGLRGLNDTHTLNSVDILALILQHQGKYEQAEELHRRALAGYKKELGESHPDTLTSVYCLADLLHAQRDHMEALRPYDGAVKGYA